ncbi:MAG: PriCT-2 domain-containing protein, partial [Betaproteobacteria bacterium]
MAAPDRVQDTPDGALKPAAGSPMARWGQRLIDHGFRILPIQPVTKKPGLYRTERWVDYPQWTRHGARATTTHELAIWSRWPEAGIGIATGNAIAIDIDVTDAQAAAAIEALAKAMLGETTAVRIGKAPKRLLLYRAAEPFAGFKRQPIEVLGLGQQFVAFGVHPHTGEPYRWPADAPTDYPIDLLPTITAPQAQRFLDAAFALVPLDQRPNTLQGAAREGANEARANDITARSDVSQELRGTPEAIAQALEHIRNDDLDYDSWVRIGMAIKGALGEEGRAHFAAWSAQAPKNDAATTEQTWLSFKPQRIGAGTIYKLAFARGWSPPEDLALCGEPPESHPARTLLARLTAGLPQGSTLAPPGDPTALATPAHAPLRPASANDAVFTLPANDPLFAEPAAETVPPPEPLPPGWDCVGGVLGELMALMTKTAKRPQPVLALGASLCALGA